MKKLRVVILVAGAAGAIYAVTRPEAPPPPPSILRAPVSFGSVLETVHATGTLEPLRRVNVGSQVSGTIKALYADFNSVVRKDQILAEIDTSLLEVQVAIQEANIERQRADVGNQEVLLADQRRQFNRIRELYESGLQSQQQFEAAALAVRSRESQLDATKRQLVQAEASLSAARMNVTYATIRAPIDGVIVQRRVDRGQTVQASMNTPSLFMMCTPLELLKLTAWVDEADIGRVRPGQTVQFRVSTYGNELFEGTVEAIRLNATNANSVVTYPVWIHVPNDDLRLRPSMTADVQIHVSSTTAVARIPNDALKFKPTRAMYETLGVEPPQIDTVRAVDRLGDAVVDPNTLRAVAIDEDADSIDELFAPLPRADARATVWSWDETARRFTPIPVRVGVTDGTMTELLEGEIKVGDELVTGFVINAPQPIRPGGNPLAGRSRGR